MSRSILAACFSAVFSRATTGLVLTGFALALGAGEFQIGLLIGTIPLFALTAQVVSAYLIETLRERKSYWTIACGIHRAVWLPVILIPYLFMPFDKIVRVEILMGLVLISQLLAAAATPAWYSWMADVVPEARIGQFWARRSAFEFIAFTVVGIPIAFYLDHTAKNTFHGFAVILILGVSCGLFDVFLHRRIPHPPMAPKPPELSPLSLFLAPLQNREFRRLLILESAWGFAVQLFVPFTMVYLLRDLKMGYLPAMLVSCVSVISYARASRFWAYMVDHYGKKPVIIVVMALKFLPAAGYLFTSPGLVYQILIPVFLVDGWLNAGLTLSFRTAVLSYSPREGKSAFFAVHDAITGLVASAGPVLMGAVLAMSEGFHWEFGILQWHNIHLAFLGSAVVRIIVWPLAFRLKEPGSAPATHVVGSMFEGNPFRTTYHLHVLSESSDEEERLRSVQAMERKPSRMALADLIEALRDPSRDIRVAAANALGAIGSQKAVRALIDALRSPDLDIQVAAARALGAVPSKQSVEALIDELASDDTILRGHIVRALGETRLPEAAPPLIELFQPGQSSPVLASAAEALSQIGEVQAVRAILPQLQVIRESTARRQMAVAVGNLLGEEGEFYSILADESRGKGLSAGRFYASSAGEMDDLATKNGLGEWRRQRLKDAYDHYIRGEYRKAARGYNLLCQSLLGIRAEDEDADRHNPELVGRIERIVSKEPKLGTQLWFLTVVGSLDFAPGAELGPEAALLAQYVFGKVVATLRRRPDLLKRLLRYNPPPAAGA